MQWFRSLTKSGPIAPGPIYSRSGDLDSYSQYKSNTIKQPPLSQSQQRSRQLLQLLHTWAYCYLTFSSHPELTLSSSPHTLFSRETWLCCATCGKNFSFFGKRNRCQLCASVCCSECVNRRLLSSLSAHKESAKSLVHKIIYPDTGNSSHNSHPTQPAQRLDAKPGEKPSTPQKSKSKKNMKNDPSDQLQTFPQITQQQNLQTSLAIFFQQSKTHQTTLRRSIFLLSGVDIETYHQKQLQAFQEIELASKQPPPKDPLVETPPPPSTSASSGFFTRMRAKVSEITSTNAKTTTNSTQPSAHQQQIKTNLQLISNPLPPLPKKELNAIKVCLECCSELDAIDRGLDIDATFQYVDEFIAASQTFHDHDTSTTESYFLHYFLHNLSSLPFTPEPLPEPQPASESSSLKQSQSSDNQDRTQQRKGSDSHDNADSRESEINLSSVLNARSNVPRVTNKSTIPLIDPGNLPQNAQITQFLCDCPMHRFLFDPFALATNANPNAGPADPSISTPTSSFASKTPKQAPSINSIATTPIQTDLQDNQYNNTNNNAESPSTQSKPKLTLTQDEINTWLQYYHLQPFQIQLVAITNLIFASIYLAIQQAGLNQTATQQSDSITNLTISTFPDSSPSPMGSLSSTTFNPQTNVQPHVTSTQIVANLHNIITQLHQFTNHPNQSHLTPPSLQSVHNVHHFDQQSSHFLSQMTHSSSDLLSHHSFHSNSSQESTIGCAFNPQSKDANHLQFHQHQHLLLSHLSTYLEESIITIYPLLSQDDTTMTLPFILPPKLSQLQNAIAISASSKPQRGPSVKQSPSIYHSTSRTTLQLTVVPQTIDYLKSLAQLLRYLSINTIIHRGIVLSVLTPADISTLTTTEAHFNTTLMMTSNVVHQFIDLVTQQYNSTISTGLSALNKEYIAASTKHGSKKHNINNTDLSSDLSRKFIRNNSSAPTNTNNNNNNNPTTPQTTLSSLIHLKELLCRGDIVLTPLRLVDPKLYKPQQTSSLLSAPNSSQPPNQALQNTTRTDKSQDLSTNTSTYLHTLSPSFPLQRLLIITPSLRFNQPVHSNIIITGYIRPTDLTSISTPTLYSVSPFIKAISARTNLAQTQRMQHAQQHVVTGGHGCDSSSSLAFNTLFNDNNYSRDSSACLYYSPSSLTNTNTNTTNTTSTAMINQSPSDHSPQLLLHSSQQFHYTHPTIDRAYRKRISFIRPLTELLSVVSMSTDLNNIVTQFQQDKEMIDVSFSQLPQTLIKWQQQQQHQQQLQSNKLNKTPQHSSTHLNTPTNAVITESTPKRDEAGTSGVGNNINKISSDPGNPLGPQSASPSTQPPLTQAHSIKPGQGTNATNSSSPPQQQPHLTRADQILLQHQKDLQNNPPQQDFSSIPSHTEEILVKSDLLSTTEHYPISQPLSSSFQALNQGISQHAHSEQHYNNSIQSSANINRWSQRQLHFPLNLGQYIINTLCRTNHDAFQQKIDYLAQKNPYKRSQILSFTRPTLILSLLHRTTTQISKSQTDNALQSALATATSTPLLPNPISLQSIPINYENIVTASDLSVLPQNKSTYAHMKQTIDNTAVEIANTSPQDLCFSSTNSIGDVDLVYSVCSSTNYLHNTNAYCPPNGISFTSNATTSVLKTIVPVAKFYHLITPSWRLLNTLPPSSYQKLSSPAFDQYQRIPLSLSSMSGGGGGGLDLANSSTHGMNASNNNRLFPHSSSLIHPNDTVINRYNATASANITNSVSPPSSGLPTPLQLSHHKLGGQKPDDDNNTNNGQFPSQSGSPAQPHQQSQKPSIYKASSLNPFASTPAAHHSDSSDDEFEAASSTNTKHSSRLGTAAMTAGTAKKNSKSHFFETPPLYLHPQLYTNGCTCDYLFKNTDIFSNVTTTLSSQIPVTSFTIGPALSTYFTNSIYALSMQNKPQSHSSNECPCAVLQKIILLHPEIAACTLFSTSSLPDSLPHMRRIDFPYYFRPNRPTLLVSDLLLGGDLEQPSNPPTSSAPRTHPLQLNRTPSLQHQTSLDQNSPQPRLDRLTSGSSRTSSAFTQLGRSGSDHSTSSQRGNALKLTDLGSLLYINPVTSQISLNYSHFNTPSTLSFIPIDASTYNPNLLSLYPPHFFLSSIHLDSSPSPQPQSSSHFSHPSQPTQSNPVSQTKVEKFKTELENWAKLDSLLSPHTIYGFPSTQYLVQKAQTAGAYGAGGHSSLPPQSSSNLTTPTTSFSSMLGIGGAVVNTQLYSMTSASKASSFLSLSSSHIIVFPETLAKPPQIATSSGQFTGMGNGSTQTNSNRNKLDKVDGFDPNNNGKKEGKSDKDKKDRNADKAAKKALGGNKDQIDKDVIAPELNKMLSLDEDEDTALLITSMTVSPTAYTTTLGNNAGKAGKTFKGENDDFDVDFDDLALDLSTDPALGSLSLKPTVINQQTDDLNGLSADRVAFIKNRLCEQYRSYESTALAQHKWKKCPEVDLNAQVGQQQQQQQQQQNKSSHMMKTKDDSDSSSKQVGQFGARLEHPLVDRFPQYTPNLYYNAYNQSSASNVHSHMSQSPQQQQQQQQQPLNPSSVSQFNTLNNQFSPIPAPVDFSSKLSLAIIGSSSTTPRPNFTLLPHPSSYVNVKGEANSGDILAQISTHLDHFQTAFPITSPLSSRENSLVSTPRDTASSPSESSFVGLPTPSSTNSTASSMQSTDFLLINPASKNIDSCSDPDSPTRPVISHFTSSSATAASSASTAEIASFTPNKPLTAHPQNESTTDLEATPLESSFSFIPPPPLEHSESQVIPPPPLEPSASALTELPSTTRNENGKSPETLPRLSKISSSSSSSSRSDLDTTSQHSTPSKTSTLTAKQRVQLELEQDEYLSSNPHFQPYTPTTATPTPIPTVAQAYTNPALQPAQSHHQTQQAQQHDNFSSALSSLDWITRSHQNVVQYSIYIHQAQDVGVYTSKTAFSRRPAQTSPTLLPHSLINASHHAIDLFTSQLTNQPNITQSNINSTKDLLHYTISSSHLSNGSHHQSLLTDLKLLVQSGFNFDYRYILQYQPNGYNTTPVSPYSAHNPNATHNITIILIRNSILRFASPIEFAPEFQAQLRLLIRTTLPTQNQHHIHPSTFIPTPYDTMTFLQQSAIRTQLQRVKLHQIVGFLTIIHNLSQCPVDTSSFPNLIMEHTLSRALSDPEPITPRTARSGFADHSSPSSTCPDSLQLPTDKKHTPSMHIRPFTSSLSTSTSTTTVPATFNQVTSLIHCSFLHTIWAYAMNYDEIPAHIFSDPTIPKPHLPSLPSDKLHTLLGFQGSTPHSDFRSQSLLCLHSVLYIAVKYRNFFKSLIFMHEGIDQLPLVYGVGWAYESDERYKNCPKYVPPPGFIAHDPNQLNSLTNATLGTSPTSPTSPRDTPSTPGDGKALKPDPHTKYLKPGMKPLQFYYNHAQNQPNNPSQPNQPSSTTSPQLTQSDKKVPKTRHYPIIAVINNIVGLVTSFLPSQCTFVSTLDTHFKQHAEMTSPTSLQPQSPSPNMPYDLCSPIPTPADQTPPQHTTSSQLADRPHRRDIDASEGVVLVEKDYLDFTSHSYFTDLIKGNKYDTLWDVFNPSRASQQNRNLHDSPLQPSQQPPTPLPAWSLSGLHTTLTPFIVPTNPTSDLNNTNILSTLTTSQLHGYLNHLFNNNTFYYYPKLVASPLIRLYLNDTQTCMANNLPTLSFHTMFFELVTNLVALADVLAIRLNAQYMDFPFLFTTIHNRFSSLLNRDFCSFQQLLSALWSDEESFILHWQQLQVQYDGFIPHHLNPVHPSQQSPGNPSNRNNQSSSNSHIIIINNNNNNSNNNESSFNIPLIQPISTNTSGQYSMFYRATDSQNPIRSNQTTNSSMANPLLANLPPCLKCQSHCCAYVCVKNDLSYLYNPITATAFTIPTPPYFLTQHHYHTAHLDNQLLNSMTSL